MRADLRTELLKQRSIRTGLGLFVSMLGLVLFAELLHGFGVAAENLDGSSEQLTILFGRGEMLGSLFAALFGALAITSEVRHGTIRPTFLVSPRRGRVIAAKVWVSLMIGAGFGLAACAFAAVLGSAVLGARGIEVLPGVGDFALLLAGGATAAALWAAVGVGLGAIVRSQVPTLIGISAWLLFVEGLLIGDIGGFAEVGRFAPGAAAAAITGQDPGTLLAPAAGLSLLISYAAVAVLAGVTATARRDVA